MGKMKGSSGVERINGRFGRKRAELNCGSRGEAAAEGGR